MGIALFTLLLLTSTIQADPGQDAPAAAAPAPILVLSGLDPVELAAGREVPGLPDLARVEGRYEYRFASAENRTTFDGDPARWEVQLGGACGRMGPLSGLGDPERFAVHDGRLYLFASDSCRQGFLKEPARHLDRDDPAPEPTWQSSRRGLELVELALAGLGGAEQVDGWTSWRAVVAGSSEVDGGTSEWSRAEIVRFPDEFRTESHWQGGQTVAVSTPTGGFVERSGVVEPLHPSERVTHRKGFHRNPLVILRARGRADFLAVAAGPATVGDVPVERVACSTAGATTVLGIDPATGRVLQATYRGRDGIGPIGYVEWTYGDFRDVGGVLVPFERSSTFDGEERTEPVRWSSIELDGELGRDLFEIPAAASR